MPLVTPRLFRDPSDRRPVTVPSEIKLLPCPCCGGAASFVDSLLAPGVCVQCRTCGLSTPIVAHNERDFGGRDSAMYLASLWNRRNDSRGMLMNLAHVSGSLMHVVSKYCNEVGCDIDAGLLSEVQMIREMCMAILKEDANGT